eukprot:TRINITY_DN54162_c0_g1_i1.p1 TRINITY_DN54162_c0_g1~~TRINITY_DN54162_c0_g1_i1.p1  ORF type:complete len:557 (+),score=76.60 TRINITY_DN54162_c0_g1_i1:26-1672(+)
MQFSSRRSPVYSRGGIVSTSQPIASQVGLSILAAGGNAIDAAVAAAAALNLTEPCSTGIGGDAFVLYYDAAKKTVQGMNGSGRCPAALNIDLLRSKGYLGNTFPNFDINTVTVPGAAALWCDAVEKWGTLPLSRILQPAIDLARRGVPIEPVAAHGWAAGREQLLLWGERSDMLVDGTRPPSAGEVFTNPFLANTFEELAAKGKTGFYEGRVAEAIVEAVQRHGGLLSLQDLKEHHTELVEPISVDYRGYTLHEIPPNGQGITALIALNILSGFEFAETEQNSERHLHLVIEALRLAFADAQQFVCDQDFASPEHKAALERLLSPSYAAERRALIDPDKAQAFSHGTPQHSCDTVYFSVVDKHGNAASFINSNYMGFGTGLMPSGCGFTLQNRGRNFVLDPTHPNALAPRKRPYHTIIPGMITKDGNLFSCFGVMGGFMQPQGHVQVAMGLIDFKLDSQAAVDTARVCLQPDQGKPGELYPVAVEDGLPLETVEGLRKKGHVLQGPLQGHARSLFGRGQVIRVVSHNPRVICAGSDPRADGCAMAWEF